LQPLFISYFINSIFQYYAESHALIYVIDSNDRERIEESQVAFGKSRGISLKAIVVVARSGLEPVIFARDHEMHV
jgi:hypothetical protein